MARSKRRDDILRKKGLRRVRRQKRRQRDAINASRVTPPMPTIDPNFRRNWISGRKNRQKFGSRRAPYGTYDDYNKKLGEVDGERGRIEEGPIQQMPIHGPPNWDQIWYDWNDVGHDYEEPVEPNSPLPADQLKQVCWYANKHGKVKDVRFIRRLGQGNNASVWMVYGLMGEPVKLACKVFKPPGKNSSLANERMLRIMEVGVGEYTALCRLDHPNIIKYYDVITIADRKTRFPFSAILTFTELCHGDLFTILEVFRTLTWEQTRRWFTQIARAVAYLHSEPTGLHSIAHRDIKPENIMFKFPLDGLQVDEPTLLAHWDAITYKLGDFGTFAYLPRIDHTVHQSTISTVFGTRSFIAPELLHMHRTRGPPVQAKPCDVHSLGMTLAMTMMEYAVFKDIGNEGLMPDLMAQCSMGHWGRQEAVQMVQNQLFKTRDVQLSAARVTKMIEKLLDAPAVAQLIQMMVFLQPQLRYTMQAVLQEINTL